MRRAGGRGKGGRGEEGRRTGGVLPMRLRYESGHRRCEACEPYNGPHKLA